MPGLAQVSHDVDDEDSLQGGRRDNHCVLCVCPSLRAFFLLCVVSCNVEPGTRVIYAGPESTEAASTEPTLL